MLQLNASSISWDASTDKNLGDGMMPTLPYLPLNLVLFNINTLNPLVISVCEYVRIFTA
jgi:hypothetical protein